MQEWNKNDFSIFTIYLHNIASNKNKQNKWEEIFDALR